MKVLVPFLLFIAVLSDYCFAEDRIVIARRGASELFPEHTLSAYKEAIEQGADFIEPELALTKDNIFVARRHIYLSTTTDVASRPEFQRLRKVRHGRSDWFIEDFTLIELKKLRAVNPVSSKGQILKGDYSIPTLDEIMILVRLNNVRGGKAGLYPKILFQKVKADAGMDVQKLVSVVRIMQAANIPYFIHSARADFLKRLHHSYVVDHNEEIPLIQSIYMRNNGSPSQDISTLPSYITGISLEKNLLYTNTDKGLGFIRKVNLMNLKVHIWTVKNTQFETAFNSVGHELVHLKMLGVDGVFADNPNTAIQYFR
ncbi:glycerophosphodiester phosphodiesterase family protein [Temperatibacter marinus]|uniref:glycerophosphodiester phosphodiesterase n=1 Tax=Temperatibacter marinus TaxID=1456591 RepID=A0AA52EBI4_9PROT|nr:glycerophosphodiester phosphodiesterase family protein [Temperatibacter marinus]WND02297.1 glycerophosphodiester phosphodiesterase family protein [Temperatibacter marinus]